MHNVKVLIVLGVLLIPGKHTRICMCDACQAMVIVNLEPWYSMCRSMLAIGIDLLELIRILEQTNVHARSITVLVVDLYHYYLKTKCIELVHQLSRLSSSIVHRPSSNSVII